ncbi:MAG TPA: pyridoxal 5'-phosphate synthase glutaminase subunit PdxT [Nitrososphaeraceae archaeon]
MRNSVNIGVLGLQGDIEENIISTRSAMKKARLSGDIKAVRYSEDIEKLDAMIIPGGESTVMSSLISAKVFHSIKRRISEGMPVLGICAGMILLSKSAYDRVVGESKQNFLSALDITVERNAFGRQNDSFETYLSIPLIGKSKIKAIFIRAPIVKEIGKEVEVMAKFEDKIVAVKQNNIIGTSFHPELGDDNLFSLFVKRASKA